MKGVILLKLTGWMITAGIGAAAGAVAILMMPHNNPTRRLAAKAADKVEDAALAVTDKVAGKLEM